MNNIIDERLEQIINKLTNNSDVSDVELESISKEINNRIAQSEYAIRDAQEKLNASLGAINDENLKKEISEILSSNLSNAEKMNKCKQVTNLLEDMYKSACVELLSFVNQIKNPDTAENTQQLNQPVLEQEVHNPIPLTPKTHEIAQPVVPETTTTAPTVNVQAPSFVV